MDNSYSMRKIDIKLKSDILQKTNLVQTSFSKYKKKSPFVKEKFEKNSYIGVHKGNKLKLNSQENLNNLLIKEKNFINKKNIILNGNNIHQTSINNKSNLHTKNISSNLMSMNGINISYSELERHFNIQKSNYYNNNEGTKNKHSNETTLEKTNSSLSKNNIFTKINISSKNLNLNLNLELEKELEKNKTNNINNIVKMKINKISNNSKNEKTENIQKSKTKKIFSQKKYINYSHTNLFQGNFCSSPNNLITDLKKYNYNKKNRNNNIKHLNNIDKNYSHCDSNSKIKTNKNLINKINTNNLFTNNQTNNYNNLNIKNNLKYKKNSCIIKKNSTNNLIESLSFCINDKNDDNNNNNTCNFINKNENEIYNSKYIIDKGSKEKKYKKQINACLSTTSNISKNNLLSFSSKFFDFSPEIEGPECLHFFYVKLNQHNKNIAYKFENCDVNNKPLQIFDFKKNN
jgi:hypothetical protein